MDPAKPESADQSAMWTPVARGRAHELVIDAIEEQVAAGRLKVGDTLPPEREFAARLGVSRAGVREAIRVLEGHGVLESRVGAGRESGTVITSMPSPALTRLLRLHIGLSNFPTKDVTETRVALERASATAAARNASDEHLAAMVASLKAMDRSGVTVEEFNDADTDFHVAIAEAAENRLLADLTIAIRASLRAPILVAMNSVERWPELRGHLTAQHWQIYDEIAAGKAVRAADLLEDHIRFAFRELPV